MLSYGAILSGLVMILVLTLSWLRGGGICGPTRPSGDGINVDSAIGRVHKTSTKWSDKGGDHAGPITVVAPVALVTHFGRGRLLGPRRMASWPAITSSF